MGSKFVHLIRQSYTPVPCLIAVDEIEQILTDNTSSGIVTTVKLKGGDKLFVADAWNTILEEIKKAEG